MKRLSDLLQAARRTQPAARVLSGLDPEVASIHYRAQDVAPGGAFVAVPGTRADGHDWIPRALERGARVLVVGRPVEVSGDVAVVVTDDPREAMASMAHELYGNPTQKLTVIGVTGTNAKTSICYLVEGMLVSAGRVPGVLGTIESRYGEKRVQSQVTTPESADLARLFADMAEGGVTHAVMEVSSHALHQGRVRHVAFDCAVFSNLSEDHFDYHGDMEPYYEAKKLLFTEILDASSAHKRAWAVINADDPYGMRLSGETSAPVLSVGMAEGREIRGTDLSADALCIRGRALTPAGEMMLESRLLGRHNFYNLLCAAGVGVALGLDPRDIALGLSSVARVPGRLERVSGEGEPLVLVDYAHTPDALEKVLDALRPLTRGRLVAVFGAGGDRDAKKRPLMGEAVGRRADLAILTSDNPRTEDPLAIIAQVEAGLVSAGAARIAEADLADPGARGYVVEPDRERAIRLAVDAADESDVILVAGKGHENYQIVGTQRRFFDDRVSATQALAAHRERSAAEGGMP